MKLRAYQEQAHDAVWEQFETKSSTLVVQPTGTGKTVVFACIIKTFLERHPNSRVMVLAHREELIRQAASKIFNVTGVYPGIEMAAERADMVMFQTDRVIVSSVQTQTAGGFGGKRRMQKFKPEDFGLVIIDEAHHAVSPSYRAVIAHYRQNPNCKILGVTATPDRSDEAALGQVFESVAFVYEITDAIHDGWLVPIRTHSVHIKDLDYSHIHTVAGDLNGGELAAVLEDERMAQEVARPIVAEARWKKTLIFAASVKHAEQLSDIINRQQPGSARWVCGKTDRDIRAEMLRDYAESKFQFLVNVGVFTEGFDEPSIEMVALARPTKSRALFAQMIGRGTRPLPGIVDGVPVAADRCAAIARSRKPFVEILDFEGNAGRHKLVTAADILGGNYDTEVVELAIREAKAAGKAVDVMAGLAEAKHKIAEQNAEKERQAHRRKHVLAQVSYERKAIDLFDVLDIEPARVREWDREKKLSQKMIDMLERNGIDKPDQLPYGQAQQLVGEVIRRFKEKQCTFKMAKVLKKYGYPTNMSMTDASRTIDAIAQNGWKRPADAPVQQTAEVGA